MLYLTVFSYQPEKRNEVMRRRLEKGALVPRGMTLIGEWSALGGGKVYRVVQVDSPDAGLAAARAWSDLGQMEIIPIMSTEDAMKHAPPLF